jgi:hypothetical protein
MTNLLLLSLRATLAVLLMTGLFVMLASQASLLRALPEQLQVGALILAGLALLFTVLFQRVRGEDRIAGLEAALCRADSVRNRADDSVAESDLLLARLNVRSRLAGGIDPYVQLTAIGAELHELRQQCASTNPLLASRIDLLCRRVAAVARTVHTSHALEPG